MDHLLDNIRKRIGLVSLIILVFLVIVPIKARGAKQIGGMDFEGDLVDHKFSFSSSGYSCPSFVPGHTGLCARSAHNADDCIANEHDLAIGTGSSRWDTGELYIKFWVKYDSDYENISNNVKWLWTFGADAHNEIILESGINTIRWQCSGGGAHWSSSPKIGSGGGNVTYSINFGDIRGEWTKVEIYYRLSSGSNHMNSDGIQWIKINGNYVIYDNEVVTGLPGALSCPSINATCDQPSGHGWWEIDDYEVWDGLPDSGSDNSPTIQISSPTSEDTFSSNEQILGLSGNVTDDNGIATITWVNNRGGSGTANNDSGDWTSWSVASIPLQEGENVITIIATDTTGQTATDTITVTYNAEGIVQIWSANDQTGDFDWDDSGAMWCARVLIEGDSITQAGSQIILGFHGRGTGDYRIRKVSIAEKDMNGDDGDVVDSTWTKVTFDGKNDSTWDSDIVTVSSGSIKLSNPVSFNIQPGKDYYVTYLLESPSVYLIAPSYYQEMYFEGSDHTEDVDWSSNGHSTYEARLHAIAAIYVTSAGPEPDTFPPTAPRNLSVK